MNLYHGSHLKLDVLKPFVSTHKKEYVYATANYNFALCYAGKQWNDFEINQSYYNGELMLTEIQLNMFEKIFDTYGYVYKLPIDTFIKFNKHEYISTVEVKPKEVIYIDNVLEELKKNIILYEYPNLPPFIKNRKEYIIDHANKLIEITKDYSIREYIKGVFNDEVTE